MDILKDYPVSMLNDLLQLRETKEDLSKLPKDVMSAIKSNIRKGAEDLQQKWANALELVHKAYEVEGVERPDPTMESAWKQYEENLQYAVQQLASNRGMDADWRMSSSMFHEALQHRAPYRVDIIGKNLNESFVVEAKNITEVIETINVGNEYDISVNQTSPNEATVRFSRWGIRKNIKVHVSRT